MRTQRIIDCLVACNLRWSKSCIALSLVVTMIGLLCLPRIEVNFGDSLWFDDEDPTILDLKKFEEDFGNDEFIALVVGFKQGVFRQESIEILQDLTERMDEVSHVTRVESLTNYNRTRASESDIIIEDFIPGDIPLTLDFLQEKRKEALEDEILSHLYLNPDAHMTTLYGQLELGRSQESSRIIVGEMKEIMASYKSNENLEFHLLGAPVFNHEFQSTSFRDLSFVLPWLFFAIIVLLLFYFRSWPGVVIPLLVIITSVVGSLALIPLLGFSINAMTIMLPGILLAIAVADSIHLLVTFYHIHGPGKSLEGTLGKVLAKNFRPLVITSVTTSIGFFSLASSDIVPIRQLGILMGIGPLLALLHTYLLVIPLLYLFRCGPKERFKQRGLSQFLSTRWVSFLGRRRSIVVLTFTLLTFAMLTLAFQNRVNANVYRYFKPDSPINIAMKYMEEKGAGGFAGPEVVVDSRVEGGAKEPSFLRRVESFQHWLESQPQVGKTSSLVNIVKDINQSLHGGQGKEFRIPESRELVAQEILTYQMGLPLGSSIDNIMDVDQQKLRVSVRWKIYNSGEVMAFLDKIKDKARELDLTTTVTGKVILFSMLNNYITKTYITSMTIALILITVLFIFIFRSFKIGLLSLIPNVIPLVWGAGVVSLLGIYVDTGCVIVISITFGIAVDDTVYFLSHYDEKRKGGGTIGAALRHVFDGPALSLVITTAILVTCFVLFVLSDLVPNRNFGLISSIILFFALVCDLVFMPALLLRFSRERG